MPNKKIHLFPLLRRQGIEGGTAIGLKLSRRPPSLFIGCTRDIEEQLDGVSTSEDREYKNQQHTILLDDDSVTFLSLIEKAYKTALF